MAHYEEKRFITFRFTEDNFYVIETHQHYSKSTITLVPNRSWRLVLYGGKRYNWHENDMPEYLDFSHAILFMRHKQWRLVIPAYDHLSRTMEEYYHDLKKAGLMEESDRVYSRPNFEIYHFNSLPNQDRHFSMTYGLGVE